MEFFYKKNKNNNLFSNLEKDINGRFEKTQNYIPIYSRYFSLNQTNWNAINLNNNKLITQIERRENDNNFIVRLNNGKTIHSFFKLAPLLDPVRYMVGKYKDISVNNTPINEKLPQYNVDTYSKIDDANNMAYTDGFFTYLSSKLKSTYYNPHCVEFYGSYLSIKNGFKVNVYDDIEYLYDSEYFLENLDKDFTINGDVDNEILNFDTRKNKQRIRLDKTLDNISISSLNTCDLNEVFKINEMNDNILHLSDVKNIDDFVLDKEWEEEQKCNKSIQNKTVSTCSSRTSCTSKTFSEIHNCEDDIKTSIQNKTHSDEDNETDISSVNSDDTEYLEAEFKKFPVQIIAMEKMHMTLDTYMENYTISKREWLSIFMQIFMILLTYKKAFEFTHNDLHTNNIMFNETDEEYLYYKFNKIFYKVPTYGKIYKIIDFGRSIYKFKGKLICSDSYHEDGDAATQFNFGPYYNKDKPEIKPNYAFDICRLACSLYDNFVDNDHELSKLSEEEKNEYVSDKSELKEIEELIIEWCKDDLHKNILYKKNGKDRYPGFKLYKMITRTVHNHTPERQLERKIFKQFSTKLRNINRQKLINIDAIKSEV